WHDRPFLRGHWERAVQLSVSPHRQQWTVLRSLPRQRTKPRTGNSHDQSNACSYSSGVETHETWSFDCNASCNRAPPHPYSMALPYPTGEKPFKKYEDVSLVAYVYFGAPNFSVTLTRRKVVKLFLRWLTNWRAGTQIVF